MNINSFTKDDYKGWSNFHTWQLVVIISNDERHYNSTRRLSLNSLQRYVKVELPEVCQDGIDWTQVEASL